MCFAYFVQCCVEVHVLGVWSLIYLVGMPAPDIYIYIHTYIHTYVHAVESKTGPRFAFHVKNGPSLICFPFFVIFFFLQGAWDYHRMAQKVCKIDHFHRSKTGPSRLHNILGPALAYAWTNFLLLDLDNVCSFILFWFCRNHYFCSVFSTKLLLYAHPPKLGTLFVNTTVLTDKNIWGVFLRCFGGECFCRVRFSSFSDLF